MKSLANCGEIWKHSGQKPPNCLRSFDTIALPVAPRSARNKAKSYCLVRITLDPKTQRTVLSVPDEALVLRLAVPIEKLVLDVRAVSRGAQGAGGHPRHRHGIEMRKQNRDQIALEEVDLGLLVRSGGFDDANFAGLAQHRDFTVDSAVLESLIHGFRHRVDTRRAEECAPETVPQLGGDDHVHLAQLVTHEPAIYQRMDGPMNRRTAEPADRGQPLRRDRAVLQYQPEHEQRPDAAGAHRHLVADIDLRVFGGSALTADIDVPKHRSDAEIGEGIPITYVPARNTVFLSFALALAETANAFDVFIGVNALDYSGYPDCRPEFVKAFENVMNLATRAGVEGEKPFTLHTPLIDMTKADIIRAGTALGVDYAETLSCYDPTPEGAHCGACDACHLRQKGFREAGIADPTPYAT